MEDVTVIVTTFGSTDWASRGEATGLSHDAHHFHAEQCRSLGDARNQAVDHVDPQSWILMLDADDELSPGYIEAMCSNGAMIVTDLYVPALQNIVDGRARRAEVFTGRDIVDGLNPCPIGTLIHRDTFESVGRFWDEEAWEDWSLFRRVVLAGGSLTFVPSAVYRAHVDRQGRNSSVLNGQALRLQILDSHERWANDRSARHH